MVADSKGDASFALQLYMQLLEVLNHCHRLETGAAAKQAILSKFSAYLQRAEALKSKVSQQEQLQEQQQQQCQNGEGLQAQLQQEQQQQERVGTLHEGLRKLSTGNGSSNDRGGGGGGSPEARRVVTDGGAAAGGSGSGLGVGAEGSMLRQVASAPVTPLGRGQQQQAGCFNAWTPTAEAAAVSGGGFNGRDVGGAGGLVGPATSADAAIAGGYGGVGYTEVGCSVWGGSGGGGTGQGEEGGRWRGGDLDGKQLPSPSHGVKGWGIGGGGEGEGMGTGVGNGVIWGQHGHWAAQGLGFSAEPQLRVRLRVENLDAVGGGGGEENSVSLDLSCCEATEC